MKRKSIPKEVEVEILYGCKRRCVLCFDYDYNVEVQRGQIAHIDRNSSNNDPDNLVFLCLKHHDEYDSKTSQSRAWTSNEIKRAKSSLIAFMRDYFDEISPEMMTSSATGNPLKEGKSAITPEIYNLRIPIYNAYRELVAKVVRDAKIDIHDLFKFANETHEALFLYDAKIAKYLESVYKKGIRLQYVQKLMQSPSMVEELKWSQIVNEEADLIEWFSNNLIEARKLFKQYLHFGS